MTFTFSELTVLRDALDRLTTKLPVVRELRGRIQEQIEALTSASTQYRKVGVHCGVCGGSNLRDAALSFEVGPRGRTRRARYEGFHCAKCMCYNLCGILKKVMAV